jgi:hypothetical protein
VDIAFRAEGTVWGRRDADGGSAGKLQDKDADKGSEGSLKATEEDEEEDDESGSDDETTDNGICSGLDGDKR